MKKLKTTSLKVQSFVTNVMDNKAKTVMGGVPPYTDDVYACTKNNSDETCAGTSCIGTYVPCSYPYACD